MWEATPPEAKAGGPKRRPLGDHGAADGLHAIHAHDLIGHGSGLVELVLLYRRVFNGVGLPDLWSVELVEKLLSQRLDRPGVDLALVEGQRIVGAFFAALVLGREGPSLTEHDLVMDPAFRRKGARRRLFHDALQRANETSRALFSEDIALAEVQTYRAFVFPREWFLSIGFSTVPIYTAEAWSSLDRLRRSLDAPAANGTARVDLRQARPLEIPGLARLVAAREGLGPARPAWTDKRARRAFTLAFEHNPSLVLIATDSAGGIIGAFHTDTVPRRRGSCLMGIHTVVDAGRRDRRAIACRLLHAGIVRGDALARQRYGRGLESIEIDPADSPDLRSQDLGLEMDETYVGLRARFADLLEGLARGASRQGPRMTGAGASRPVQPERLEPTTVDDGEPEARKKRLDRNVSQMYTRRPMNEKRPARPPRKAKGLTLKKRERKERVLHTRVPESLETEIKGKAGRLGLSVSNLVRNILQNAFEMVDDIVQDSHAIARSARGVAVAHRQEPPRILGWQGLVLSVNAVCERCNKILAQGTPAHVSVLEGAGPRLFRCRRCAGKTPDPKDEHG